MITMCRQRLVNMASRGAQVTDNNHHYDSTFKSGLRARQCRTTIPLAKLGSLPVEKLPYTGTFVTPSRGSHPTLPLHADG